MRVRQALATTVLVGLGAIAACWWGTHTTEEPPAASLSTSARAAKPTPSTPTNAATAPRDTINDATPGAHGADVANAPSDRGGRRTSPRNRVRTQPDGEASSATGRGSGTATLPSTPADATPPGSEKPAADAPADAAVSIRRVGPSGETGVGTLTVIVTDSDGRPRSGVRLEIQSSGAAVSRATSAIDLGTAGRTDLRGCSPGRVTLDLSVGDLHRVVAANVVAGEASEVTVRMAVEKGAAVEGTGSVGDGVVAGEAPPEVAARKDHAGSGVIRGRILEHGTGKPMSGVAVQISGAEVVTTTDDDGNFRLEAVDPGPQQLTLSKDGFELRTVDTSVVAGKDIVVDETLQPATTLRLTLRRRDGSAYVGRARLILGHYTSTGTIGTSDDITFDKDGSAVFRQILPGLYRVVVIVDHVGQARVLEVKIPLGATTLDLVLQ